VEELAGGMLVHLFASCDAIGFGGVMADDRRPTRREAPPMSSTSRDRILRGALWATAGLNVLGAIIFALPALSRSSPLLPMAVPPYFAAQIGFTIALFAGVYAWLALQPTFHRPLIVVGGLGKLGFFGLTAAYAAAGEVPVVMALNATPDLLFAMIFFWWSGLRGRR
jgi:hypothetical protein